MSIYFNDNEPFVVPWLGSLYPGATVDGRSVEEVTPADVEGYTRAHFFAGIGGWEYALTLAEWPEASPVWTASLPCQPFSSAGKRLGVKDERHLWPVFRNLVEQCRPPRILGEQVASKAGREWLAGVRADLEALGYAVGAADLCAASAGAPHIRQRLFWVAYAERTAREQGWATDETGEGTGTQGAGSHAEPRRRGDAGGVAYADGEGPQGRYIRRDGTYQCLARPDGLGPWSAYDVIECADGKARRIPPLESGVFPVADGVPQRVGRIRAYGGAIVPQVAAEFIRAFMEAVDD
jgi:DNA (cytosine-5)-methyltransferase 1